MLHAGLRPYEFARPNRATWLDPPPGLHFEDGGFAVTAAGIDARAADGAYRFDLEIRFRARPLPPGESRTFVVLVDGASTTPFGVRQEGLDLVVWDRVEEPDVDAWYDDFRFPDRVRPGEVQSLRVLCDAERPRFWLDGVPATPSTGFPIPFARAGEPFAGRLVVGAGPLWSTPWTGDVLALAVRGPALDAAWEFTEGGGAVVANRGTAGPPLEIPRWYRPPNKRVLGLPRFRDVEAGWYLADSAWNLLGFVPLGALLVVVARVRARRRPRAALLLATAIGGLLSLGIELAQVPMVTRDSSLQDLVLNTLGTALGAALALRLTGARTRPA